MDSRLLWGIVEMLILEVLNEGPNYGYEIAQRVTSRSQGYFHLKEGSLYPALHRLERGRLLSSSWTETQSGRRRKYYRLTRAGQRVLAARREEWRRFAAGVSGVMGGACGMA